MAGAGLAFLWFNTHPAQVFMGDVGALALGGALGTIAVIVRQEIVLSIMGGIFVVEALSVMAQVTYFKYTKKRYGEGRRILKMAPLHHHFEKSGWKETQVVVRFWIITMLLCLVGLSTLEAAVDDASICKTNTSWSSAWAPPGLAMARWCARQRRAGDGGRHARGAAAAGGAARAGAAGAVRRRRVRRRAARGHGSWCCAARACRRRRSRRSMPAARERRAARWAASSSCSPRRWRP